MQFKTTNHKLFGCPSPLDFDVSLVEPEILSFLSAHCDRWEVDVALPEGYVEGDQIPFRVYCYVEADVECGQLSWDGCAFPFAEFFALMEKHGALSV